MKRSLLIISLILFTITGAFAQPGHGGDNNGGGHGVPLDGGVIAMVLVGVAYGAKRNINKEQ